MGGINLKIKTTEKRFRHLKRGDYVLLAEIDLFSIKYSIEQVCCFKTTFLHNHKYFMTENGKKIFQHEQDEFDVILFE